MIRMCGLSLLGLAARYMIGTPYSTYNSMLSAPTPLACAKNAVAAMPADHSDRATASAIQPSARSSRAARSAQAVAATVGAAIRNNSDVLRAAPGKTRMPIACAPTNATATAPSRRHAAHPARASGASSSAASKDRVSCFIGMAEQ